MGCTRDSSPRWACRVALALAVLTLLSPASFARADPIHFMFGVPGEITLAPNQLVAIPAAIINTGARALDLSCSPCDYSFYSTLEFDPVTSAPPYFRFGPPGNNEDTFYPQFAGLTLGPGQRFDFVFASFNVANTPVGAVFLWGFGFHIRPAVAAISPAVVVGHQTAFSALAFVDSETPVPEPSTLLLVGSGVVYLLRRRTSRLARLSNSSSP